MRLDPRGYAQAPIRNRNTNKSCLPSDSSAQKRLSFTKLTLLADNRQCLHLLQIWLVQIDSDGRSAIFAEMNSFLLGAIHNCGEMDCGFFLMALGANHGSKQLKSHIGCPRAKDAQQETRTKSRGQVLWGAFGHCPGARAGQGPPHRNKQHPGARPLHGPQHFNTRRDSMFFTPDLVSRPLRAEDGPCSGRGSVRMRPVACACWLNFVTTSNGRLLPRSLRLMAKNHALEAPVIISMVPFRCEASSVQQNAAMRSTK
jgi:hypothetical protein